MGTFYEHMTLQFTTELERDLSCAALLHNERGKNASSLASLVSL